MPFERFLDRHAGHFGSIEAHQVADDNIALQCGADMTIITDYQTTLALYTALGELLEWNGQLGSFDASCWRRAKALQTRLQRANARQERRRP